jgi:hypothetical protein
MMNRQVLTFVDSVFISGCRALLHIIYGKAPSHTQQLHKCARHNTPRFREYEVRVQCKQACSLSKYVQEINPARIFFFTFM